MKGPRVKATSVIIGNGISDEMQIETKLRRLDEENERERIEFRFAFIFTKIGTKADVECASFRKVFGNVPLIGFFHTERFGMDYLNSTNFTKLRKYDDSTSVFLLVTVTKA